jgi:hypothetical protein
MLCPVDCRCHSQQRDKYESEGAQVLQRSRGNRQRFVDQEGAYHFFDDAAPFTFGPSFESEPKGEGEFRV